MTFSIGLKEEHTGIDESSIRRYYKEVIESDRTMIKALQDVVLDSIHEIDNTCQEV